MSSSREREVAEQLAQLKWKRSQNEKSVRAALISTKTLKQKDTILNLTARQNFDKSVWVDSVLKDELSRPLIISDEEYVMTMTEDEKLQKRLLKYSFQQLSNIDKLADHCVATGNKSAGAMQTKHDQLVQFQKIKNKLNAKIKIIETKKAYTNLDLGAEGI